MVDAIWWAAGCRHGQFKVEVFLSGQDNQKILVKIMRDSTGPLKIGSNVITNLNRKFMTT
jgi:hypothetical protein